MTEITETTTVKPMKDTEWIMVISKHSAMDSGWAGDSLIFKTLDEAVEYATNLIKHPPEDVRYIKVDLS